MTERADLTDLIARVEAAEQRVAMLEGLLRSVRPLVASYRVVPSLREEILGARIDAALNPETR